MSRRTNLLFAFVFLAVVGSTWAGQNQATLSSTLDIDDAWYARSGEISGYFAITNHSSEAIHLLQWQTPFDGIDADIFEVERDGEAVRYIGKIVKRAAPRTSDFMTLEPGETVSGMFDDLALAYDMSLAGEYTVRYRVPVVQAVMGEALAARAEGEDFTMYLLPEVVSNSVGMWLEDPVMSGERLALGESEARDSGQFNKCRPRERGILLEALDNAGMISDLAVEHVAQNPSGSELYQWWFGEWTRSRFETVKENFLAIAGSLNNEPVTFDCTCSSGAYAYVYANNPYNIFLCNAFWRAPALGRDSQAGTLVHEISHFYVVAGTDDFVYGATSAHNLALSNPNQAIANADNHEYFAEDQY